jgi:gas vesicle protein
MSKQIDNARLLIAALLGGLVGAVIALLFAPKSGQETRAQLNEKSQQVKKLAQQGAATVAPLIASQSIARLPKVHNYDSSSSHRWPPICAAPARPRTSTS